MTRVFITGATGYIGGDVLSQLEPKYPGIIFRVLTRDEQKGKLIKEQHPAVQIVSGDLNDAALLQEESAQADIILHTADAADHSTAARAIAAGATQGHTPEKPAYWIHTSGAGIFSYLDEDEKRYGLVGDKVFDDWDGIHEITSIPDYAFHRNVDKIVFEATANHSDVLHAAIVSPTTVYGVGRGPCSKRSRQVYELARTTLSRKKAPYIGDGESRGCHVHVHDVTDLILRLFDAALAKEKNFWGPEAYYLAENGEHRWSDVARSIASIAVAEGFLTDIATEQLEFEEAKRQAGYEAASWGLNVRSRAIRARRLLNWTPAGPSLDDELPGIVRAEWESLQKS
ncbi:hypothetical protein N7541_001721 [Penicillium brevicompactum]|uniref:NAD-dependent epimerase/dehydratase domain-containing protein n=1 Tax=Penicillium brevicompactum TaxID=5074 RepID=A0A9W9V629_PENBR|nr:hypothetical protein N7541_001721 [Penicillium brevicompactum]